jgi:Glutamine amidotransferases class-II
MVEFRLITFSISLFSGEEVMCRLLGFVARKPVVVAQLLEGVYQSFIKVSQLHSDGWGLAWYNESDHYQIRPDALIVGSTGLNQDGDWQIL